MSTKRETLINANNGMGCLGKAADDEPVFVLRAQDKTAPDIVQKWAIGVDQARSESSKKTIAARHLADEMRAWQVAHPDRVKVPD